MAMARQEEETLSEQYMVGWAPRAGSSRRTPTYPSLALAEVPKGAIERRSAVDFRRVPQTRRTFLKPDKYKLDFSKQDT